VLYIYITRLALNEIFSLSNKIHQEVGHTKDLSAPRYKYRSRLPEDDPQRVKTCWSSSALIVQTLCYDTMSLLVCSLILTIIAWI
jgi:hypothetical protein